MTLTAPDDVVVRLREIARDEGTSLAEVVREALDPPAVRRTRTR